jgi:glycosyltransferase involved in cell wall biosynthesis
LHVFASFGIGGVPVRISTILNDLGAEYRHTIVALDDVFDCRARLDPGLDVRLLPVAIRKDRGLDALLRIRSTLRRVRPDLLLTYNWGAIEWALVNTLLRYSRHIHFESGFGAEEADRQIPRRVLFRRIALAGAARVVAPSTTLIDIATQAWRIPAEKLLYIPNGVDCARFDAPRSSAGIPGLERRPGELILGTLAPLRPEKNLGRLLRAFAGLPPHIDVRLAIVGEGSERPALAALASELRIGHRVVFSGHVEAPESVLGHFDVFAISSDTEQMPNALLQAMAAGLPVVGVDVGDVKRMVTEANRRFIVPKTDEASLTRAIEALLASPALRSELAAANRAHARATYGQDKMFAAYRALFAATAARVQVRAA